MTDEIPLFKPKSTEEVVRLVCDVGDNIGQIRVHGVVPTAFSTNERHVELGDMSSVIDYPARDMTITVQAGISLAELRKVLAEENQQLPIDAFADFASIGSIVAGDIAGPRRYGYGTLRDYVIGIEAVDGQGRVFHAGGRVVKNVAGYDLCRLMVGSRGALGVITQVTFKPKPIPPHSTLLAIQFDRKEDFRDALEHLNTSAATPVLIDFTYATPQALTRSDSPTDCAQNQFPMSLKIGVEGTAESCAWQVEQLKKECGGATVECKTSSDEEDPVRQHCRSFGYGWKEPSIRCLPSQVAAIADVLASKGYATVGHAGDGILFVLDDQDSGNVRSVCDAVAADFNAIVSEWDVDHPAKADDSITTRVKQTFDPNSVFAI